MSSTVFTYWSSVRFLDGDAYQRALALIPTDRVNKAQKFAFEKDRKLSVGAWLLFDEALRRMDVAAGVGKLELNDYGKPSIEGKPFFNLSHSGTIVMCSTCFECAVGCDVEQCRPFDEELALRCMQPCEMKALTALPDAMQADAFFRRWTLKESYMKAHGKGLSIPPESFAIGYSSDGKPYVCHDDSCALAEFPCVDEFRFAACALDCEVHFEPIRRIELTV